MKVQQTMVAAMASLLLLASAFVAAEPLAIKSDDTLAKLLTEQKGKRVTVRLVSGEEMTGTVRDVGVNLLQLGELAGKDFFDGIVDLTKITAIVVRSKP